MTDTLEPKSLEASLTAWVEEALNLRHGEAGDPLGKIGLPAYEAGQPAAIDMLQRVRVRLDRVEELQSMSRRAKARVIRARSQADFDAALAYDSAIQRQGATRAREYVIGDEKKADAALASLTEKRLAHQMRRAESFATEALDIVTDCYWGLEKLREDILQMIRLFNNAGFLTSQESQT